LFDGDGTKAMRDEDENQVVVVVVVVGSRMVSV
jgi:hypothetical protein